jgi:hypothetical protein
MMLISLILKFAKRIYIRGERDLNKFICGAVAEGVLSRATFLHLFW